MIVVNNIELSGNICIIWIDDLTKTSSSLFHNREFRFPAYPQDEISFPVFDIREYIKPTESLCKHHYSYFLIIQNLTIQYEKTFSR